MNISYFLSTFAPTIPLMRFLAYVKNDLLRESTDTMLTKRMVKGWRNMSILDLGCGECKKERNKLFSGVKITGLDIYGPSIRICKENGVNAIRGDILKIDSYFSAKSFDIIWLIDVIEHLKKKDAMIILTKLSKIARRQILIFTPAVWFPQDSYKGNTYYKHLSFWKRRDFERLGYKTEILKRYYADVRGQAKALSNLSKPFHPDAMWAIKTL